MANSQTVVTPPRAEDIHEVERVVTADLTQPDTSTPSTPIRAPMPRRASRPPPPPIFVRTATERNDLPKTRASPEEEEANDGVGELLPMTPNRSKRISLTFEPATSPRDGPSSPRWAPMDAPNEYDPTPSRKPRPNSWHRNSLEVPSSWAPPSPSNDRQRAFDPTPQHNTHSRNLSIYFPQPGVPLPPRSPSIEAGESVIPEANNSVFGGAADWGSQGMDSPDPKRGKRRGHHHKHSLSHNFFSFLDPTQTDGSLAPGAQASPADDKPPPVALNVEASPTTMLSPLGTGKRDPQVQLLSSLAVIEAVLGAALWVEGQISGWRSLTAVGYVVVFDALGLGVNLLARRDQLDWRSLRTPYGSSRFTSLLCFAQSLFLGFAAVYIAKEALEQVVLGDGAHDHGGHGGHGHGEYSAGNERPFPTLFLLLATAASSFSGAVLGNHSRLVDATGPLFLPPWYLSNPFVAKYSVLSNPFTLSVAGVAGVLSIAALVVPTDSLKSFDATMSLGMTLLTGALFYPPTLAFGHVLLQTAPPATTLQMKEVRRALRQVADDRRVLGLGTLRTWAIDAGKVGPETTINSAPPSRRPSISTISPSTEAFTTSPQSSSQYVMTLGSGGLSSSSGSFNISTTHVPLVVTLVVHVHPDSSDSDMADITRLAWSRLSTAIGVGRAGEGEVSVAIKRGWESE